MQKLVLPLFLTVAACGPLPHLQTPFPQGPTIDATTGVQVPAEDARTVEEFDTTTQQQRDAATATSNGGENLGTTVASLGDATSPGFWLETPLVTSPRIGRVRNPATGRTVQVDLRPLPSGGSSRISLAALRLLEAPLTELVTLEVFLNS
ncbi:MAG: hypothetical protein AAF222_05935 [Pseudomonadota bacterium]